jgi:hypothetical protein
VGYTIWRAPRNVVTWVVWALLIAVNFLAASASKLRTEALGVLLAMGGDRYYFELVFLLVIFSAVAFHNARAAPRAWRPRPLVRGVCIAATAAGLIAIATSAYAETARLAAMNYAWNFKARPYLNRLRADLAGLRAAHDASLVFEDGTPPEFLGVGIFGYRHHHLLELAGVDATFARRGRASLRIDESGAVVSAHVRPRRTRARRPTRRPRSP